MKIKLITLFSALSACLIAPDASLQAIEYSTPKPTNQTLPNQQTPNPDATPKAVESTNHNTNGQNPNIQIEQDPTLINILNINPEVPEDNRISIVYPGAIRPSHLSSVSNPNCYLDVSSRLCFFVWPNQRKTGDLEITWNLYLPDRTNETMKFRSVTLDNFLTPSETTIHLYTHKDKSLNLRYTTTVAYLPKKINGCEGCEGCGILWSDHGDGFAKLHSSTSQVPLIRIRYQKNSGNLYFWNDLRNDYVRALFSSTESSILSNMPEDPATHNGLYLANIYKASHHEALVQYLYPNTHR